MSDTNTAGLILGASTATMGGFAIASLPETGAAINLLSYIAMLSGALVLGSFLLTRIIRKLN